MPEDQKPPEIDYQRMAEANAAALIRAQKREKVLRTLSRRKWWLSFRRALLFPGLIALGYAGWRWLSDGYFWPSLLVAIVLIGVRQIIPSRKKVEELEEAIESDIENGLL
jgi:hypothetical protein